MLVSEAEATAIQRAFHKQGEGVVVTELRRFFPGIKGEAHALNGFSRVGKSNI